MFSFFLVNLKCVFWQMEKWVKWIIQTGRHQTVAVTIISQSIMAWIYYRGETKPQLGTQNIKKIKKIVTKILKRSCLHFRAFFNSLGEHKLNLKMTFLFTYIYSIASKYSSLHFIISTHLYIHQKSTHLYISSKKKKKSTHLYSL